MWIPSACSSAGARWGRHSAVLACRPLGLRRGGGRGVLNESAGASLRLDQARGSDTEVPLEVAAELGSAMEAERIRDLLHGTRGPQHLFGRDQPLLVQPCLRSPPQSGSEDALQMPR